MLRYVPSIHFGESFLSWMYSEFYQMLFLHLLRWSCGFCLFFCCCGISHWLICYVEPSLWIWDNPTWSWCMILLMCCWIWFANILLRIFMSIFIKDIELVIFFSGSIFVWFWYQGDVSFVEWIWECSFLFNLLEEFGKNWYKFFFVYLVEFPSETIWSWTSVCRESF